VTAALAALTGAFNMMLSRTLDRNADDLLRARADAELAILKPVGGRLVVGEAPDEAAGDAPIWVFARGRVLEAPPRARPALDAAARSPPAGRGS
jgi:hypothetical protein